MAKEIIWKVEYIYVYDFVSSQAMTNCFFHILLRKLIKIIFYNIEHVTFIFTWRKIHVFGV